MKILLTILVMTWFMVMGCSDSKTVTKTTNTNENPSGTSVTITPLFGAELTLKYKKDGVDETQVAQLNRAVNNKGYLEGNATIVGGASNIFLCKTTPTADVPDYFCSAVDAANNWYLFAFSISGTTINGSFVYITAADYAARGTNALFDVYTTAASKLLTGSNYLANANPGGADDDGDGGGTGDEHNTTPPSSGELALTLTANGTLPSSIDQVFGCYEYLYKDTLYDSYWLAMASNGDVSVTDSPSESVYTFIGEYWVEGTSIKLSADFDYSHATHTVVNDSLLLSFEGYLKAYDTTVDPNTYLLSCIATSQNETDKFAAETVIGCSQHGATFTLTSGGYAGYLDSFGTSIGIYFMDKSSGVLEMYFLNNDPSGEQPVFVVSAQVIDANTVNVGFSDSTEACSY